MEKNISELTVEEFIDVLASREAVPGGGGASALTGALGAALGSMVGALTLGKKKYADVEEDILKLMAEAETVSAELLDCIEKDAEAFLPLSKAYGIPRDEPGRDETLEKCLRDAAAAPYEIAELSCRVIELLEGFAEKGSKLMLSDAATGAAIARGALLGAAMNVRVNTRLMKDREYASGMEEALDKLVVEYSNRADRVFCSIYGGSSL